MTDDFRSPALSAVLEPDLRTSEAAPVTLALPFATRPTRPAGPREVAALGTIVCVWAHPDDEAFLAGGLLALAREAGNRVVCVTATRGEAGTDDRDRWPPERLARIRSRELAASLRRLGVDEHRWLGLGHRDGACADADPQEATAALAELLDEVRPDTVVGFGPEGFTGHPDHCAVGAWTTAARRLAAPTARVLQPVPTASFAERYRDLHERFSVFWPDHPVVVADEDLAVDLPLEGAALDRKIAALRAQPSQTDRLVDGVGVETFRAWWGREAFVAA